MLRTHELYNTRTVRTVMLTFYYTFPYSLSCFEKTKKSFKNKSSNQNLKLEPNEKSKSDIGHSVTVTDSESDAGHQQNLVVIFGYETSLKTSQ